MKENIQIKGTGIKCDNPTCDWKDETVNHSDLKNWLNALCPKCGENVLTPEDFENVQMLYLAMELTNAMSEDEINSLNETINRDDLLKTDFFKDAQGLENIRESNSDGRVNLKISTHKGIKVTDIKRIDP